MASKFNSYILHNGEMVQFVTRFVSLLREEKGDDTFLIRQADVLDEILTGMRALSSRSASNSYTKELKQLDKKRDALSSFILKATGAKAKLDAVLENDNSSAKRLVRVFNKYGYNPQKGYSQESAEIKWIINELNSLSSELEECGVKDAFEALKETQLDFEEVFQKKIEFGAKKIKGSIIDQKRKLAKRVVYPINYIEVNSVDLPESFANIDAKVNSLIKVIMAPARGRETRRVDG